MKRFLLGVVVGIAFAALPLGCTTTVGVLSGPTESQPAQQEDRKDQEKMHEMLYPDPSQPMTK